MSQFLVQEIEELWKLNFRRFEPRSGVRHGTRDSKVKVMMKSLCRIIVFCSSLSLCHKCSPCSSDYIGFVNVHKALFWVPIESITKRLRKRNPGKRIVTSIPKTRIWFSNVAPPSTKAQEGLAGLSETKAIAHYPTSYLARKNLTFMNSCFWRALREDPRHVSATSSSLQPQHIASPVWIHTLSSKNAPQFTLSASISSHVLHT